MIDFEHVTFTYAGAPAPTIRDLDLRIPEGDLVLVVGRTGSGKSTLLQLINGLAPHFTGGHLQGSVRVGGLDTRDHQPRDLAGIVGTVIQTPRAGFVTDTVEEELAYTMESLAVAPDVMRRRVEETLDLLGLSEVRQRSLGTLSGGQQQRVAIGAALTAHPRVLVLDEPTSALDPAAAEEVLAAVQRLVHDLGLTVVMAEHRLERVIEYCDSVLLLSEGQGQLLEPVAAMQISPMAPPVVRLGRTLGWDPPPLSVREARRRATGLAPHPFTPPPARTSGRRVAQITGLGVEYGPIRALRSVSANLHSGEVVAVMGRNGAGKTSLIKALAGLLAPRQGRVRVDDHDPRELSGPELLRSFAYVPQDPTDLFYSDTVGAECEGADRDHGQPPGAAARRLAELVPGIPAGTHPRDLSAGQQLALALAVMLGGEPDLVLLDEPTRGLDYPGKEVFADMLAAMAGDGRCVVMATHDVELVAMAADRVIVLADGDLVTDAPARAALTSSPAFAPQVQKVLAPLPVLTVEEAMALA